MVNLFPRFPPTFVCGLIVNDCTTLQCCICTHTKSQKYILLQNQTRPDQWIFFAFTKKQQTCVHLHINRQRELQLSILLQKLGKRYNNSRRNKEYYKLLLSYWECPCPCQYHHPHYCRVWARIVETNLCNGNIAIWAL